MIVKIDSHPGKFHEGLVLTPVLVAAPGFSDEYRFFTGLQLGKVIEKGMFREWTQPIQVIYPLDAGMESCLFTMNNCGQVTREQIEKLVTKGYVLVNDDPYYKIELFL